VQRAGGRYAHRNCGLRVQDGLPRGPGPRCSPAVAADERDGGRGTLDRTAARLPFRAIADRTSSLLRPAAAAILACRAACSRLAHPASRRRWQACRARPHARRWPERHRRAEVVQYYSIYGITVGSWRRCAQAGEQTARPAFPAHDAAGTPADCLCAPAGPQCVGSPREGDRLSGNLRTCPAGRAGQPWAPRPWPFVPALANDREAAEGDAGHPPSPPHTPGAHRPPARAAVTVLALLIAATAAWTRQLSAVRARATDPVVTTPRTSVSRTGARTTSCILRNAHQGYPQPVDGCRDKLQLCNKPGRLEDVTALAFALTGQGCPACPCVNTPS